MEISRRQRGLPGGRAVLGGVLMAVAVVGVFVAYEQAGRTPRDPIVVAARPVRVGEVLESTDLRMVHGEMPGDSAAFTDVDALVGRVALGPIGEGEIIQASSVTEDATDAAVHEVAVTLPGRQIAVGRLKAGERVDIFVTYDERTETVARNAEVVQIGVEDDESLTSDREISLVVALPSGEAVAAVVHALRTGDVTVVRSTFADAGSDEPLTFDSRASASSTRREDDVE